MGASPIGPEGLLVRDRLMVRRSRRLRYGKYYLPSLLFWALVTLAGAIIVYEFVVVVIFGGPFPSHWFFPPHY